MAKLTSEYFISKTDGSDLSASVAAMAVGLPDINVSILYSLPVDTWMYSVYVTIKATRDERKHMFRTFGEMMDAFPAFADCDWIYFE